MKKIIFISFCLFISFTNGIFAQPKSIHLSFSGSPKTNTSNAMAITWVSEKPNNGTVRFGLDSVSLSTEAQAQINIKNDLTNAIIYKAELKKLKPATTYYYQCGSEIEGWSDIYSFITGPEIGSKTKSVIGVLSDTQNNTGNLHFEQTKIIVSELAKYPIALSIHTGDVVENGSVVSSWDNFLKATQPIYSRVPFMPATGNHDVINDTIQSNFQKPSQIYYDLFNLPRDYINYSYDYGNIHFVAINSGYAQGAAKVNKVLFVKDSPEYQWLDNDLKKVRKNKKTDWIIIYAHYPMYSFGVSLIPKWQKNLTPILDKYQVDLCLTGHRHVYERHKAIKNNQIFEQVNKHVYTKPEGTVYITNGSSGGALQGVGGNDMPSMVFTPDEKLYTYAIMTIEGLELYYEVFDKQGKKIDYFKIIK